MSVHKNQQALQSLLARQPRAIEINRFLSDISCYQVIGLFNPWSETCLLDALPKAADCRHERLRSHFACPEPQLILIGEAPGFQGCRYSGVPFTSEKQLLQGNLPRLASDGRLTQRKRPFAEPSATILWRSLAALGIADHVVLWNAVPWHPIGPRGALSNRKPTRCELVLGLCYLERLLDLFAGTPAIAIGRSAQAAFAELSITPATVLRHPSYGGARLFEQGLREYWLGIT